MTEGVKLALNAVGGVGDIQKRVRIFNALTAEGFTFPSIIHPTAFVEPSASIAEGVQVIP